MEDVVKDLLKNIVISSIPWGIIVANAIYLFLPTLNYSVVLFYILLTALFVLTGIVFSLYGLIYLFDYETFKRIIRNSTITYIVVAIIMILINTLKLIKW